MSPYESVFNETTEKIEEFTVEYLWYCKLKVTEFPTVSVKKNQMMNMKKFSIHEVP